MTRLQLENQVQFLTPSTKPGTVEHRAYMTLFALPHLGPYNTREDIHFKVAKFLEVDVDAVKPFCTRAWQNRVVRFGERNKNNFVDEAIYNGGPIALTLGVGYLLGELRREKQ